MNLHDQFDLLKKNKRALVAFNIQTISQLASLRNVVVKEHLPAIAQFSEKYISYFENITELKNIVQKYKTDQLYFHLDHSQNDEIIKHCVNSGFDSVMFDGSSLEITVNSERSNRLYDYASQYGCLLEVELGVVGGVEDGIGSDSNHYVNLQELQYFAGNTRYDLLALGIGNAHGVYSSLESINLGLFDDAKKFLPADTKFVLHGSTGMPVSMITSAIDKGVVKINVSTALKIKTKQSIEMFVKENELFDEIKLQKKLTGDLESFFHSYLTLYTK